MTALLVAGLSLLVACTSPDASETRSGVQDLDRPITTIRLDTDQTASIRKVLDAAVRSDGRVVLLQADGPHLMEFDAEGRLVDSAGRHGGGPGELEMPRQLGRCGGDSLYVLDQGHQRVLVYDPALGYARSFTLPGGAMAFECNATGDLAVISFPRQEAPTPDEPYPVAHGTLLRSNTRGDSLGPAWDIPLLAMRAMSPVTSFGVSADEVVVGPGSEPALWIYSGGEAEPRVMSWDAPAPGPPTEAQYSAAIAEQVSVFAGAEDREVSTRWMLQMPRPDRVPAYRRLVVDDEERVHVVVNPMGNAETIVRSFSTTGDSLSTLRVPYDGDLLAVERGRMVFVTSATTEPAAVRVYRVR